MRHDLAEISGHITALMMMLTAYVECAGAGAGDQGAEAEAMLGIHFASHLIEGFLEHAPVWEGLEVCHIMLAHARTGYTLHNACLLIKPQCDKAPQCCQSKRSLYDNNHRHLLAALTS